MAKPFKITPTPSPKKGPTPVLAPLEKAGLPLHSGPTTDDAQRASSPGFSSAGFSVMPSGQRAYKEEIPWAPPVAPRPPWKETK